MAWRMAVRGIKTRLRKLLGFILFIFLERGREVDKRRGGSHDGSVRVGRVG